MSKHYQKDLEALRRSLLRLAAHVEDAIASAARALRTHDRDAARQVIDGDDEIDHLENAVQDECLKILALHQPVAVDLRRISVVLMIATTSGGRKRATWLPPASSVSVANHGPGRGRLVWVERRHGVFRALQIGNQIVRSPAREAFDIRILHDRLVKKHVLDALIHTAAAKLQRSHLPRKRGAATSW